MLIVQVSPLIEKQCILFAIRKRMIGRRAYTDSACTIQKGDVKSRDASPTEYETSSTFEKETAKDFNTWGNPHPAATFHSRSGKRFL